MKKPTDRQLMFFKRACRKLQEDYLMSSFIKMNFIDYSDYIVELIDEFPKLVFELKDYGIRVSKKIGAEK